MGLALLGDTSVGGYCYVFASRWTISSRTATSPIPVAGICHGARVRPSAQKKQLTRSEWDYGGMVDIDRDAEGRHGGNELHSSRPGSLPEKAAPAIASH